MADIIVLYPSPGNGHLYSLLELGKLVAKRAPSPFVTVIIPTVPNKTDSIDSIIAFSAINFIRLPPAALPNAPTSVGEVIASFFELTQVNNLNLHESLISLSKSSKIKALIIDFFCKDAVEVSSALGIPTYFYFISSTSALCNLLYTSTISKEFTEEDLKNDETSIHCPGFPTVMKAKDLPIVLLDRSHRVFRYLVETSVQMARSAGIIGNSCESLELTAVEAIRKGYCTPEEPRPPPLYCVGPYVGSGESKNEEQCLSWLDLQPDGSVVFLCFGSMGVFSAAQLKEMAIGLEESGVRFLWVARPPTASGEIKGLLNANELTDLEPFLPEGFFERTKDRGLVVKMWAPQVKVLSHKSVGGFVTHCGWNSILESIYAEVPMLAWPLFAEQKMNELALVDELKLALRLTRSEDGMVSRDELRKRLRELMDSVEGTRVRAQGKAMKRAAEDAKKDGGSSHAALAQLVDSFGLSSKIKLDNIDV